MQIQYMLMVAFMYYKLADLLSLPLLISVPPLHPPLPPSLSIRLLIHLSLPPLHLPPLPPFPPPS